MKRRGPFIAIAAVVFIVASVGLAQCTFVEPTWDMAVPVQIIATSEVPEVERWSAALATAVTDLGGHPTMSRTTQAIWLTSSTYSWCDPTFNGRYVMYVMRSAAKQPSAIFMCWRVTSAGVWSDVTIARLMRHALGHALSARLDDLPCELHVTMSPTSCIADDGFTKSDVEYVCSTGLVVGGACEG